MPDSGHAAAMGAYAGQCPGGHTSNATVTSATTFRPPGHSVSALIRSPCSVALSGDASEAVGTSRFLAAQPIAVLTEWAHEHGATAVEFQESETD